MSNLATLRAQIAAVEAGTRGPSKVLPFGDPAVDGCFPGGGLPLGAWHEITADGMEAEIGAALAAFVARLLPSLPQVLFRGDVVWVMRRDDLYPPGLAFLGFPAERLIQVRAENDEEALGVLEEALACRGIAAAVGEVEEVPLTAGRRLQLACERGGGAGFVINRRPWGLAGRRGSASGSAAASRWKIAPAPSLPGEGGLGFGPLRWNVELNRCRGGRPGSWIFEEAGHGPHPFRVAAEVADHGLAPPLRRSA